MTNESGEAALEPDWPDAPREEILVEAHERRGSRGVREHRRKHGRENQDAVAEDLWWMGRRGGLHGEALDAYIDARLEGLNHSQAFVEALRFEKR